MKFVRVMAIVMLMSGTWAIAKAPTPGPSTAPTDLTPLSEPPDKPAVRSSAGPGTPVNKGWVEFHEAMVKRAQAANPDVCFIGDSITQLWGGPGRSVWQDKILPLKPENLGISGDRTQHVLWRLENGALDGLKPKVVVVLIGINNIGTDEPSAIAAGIKAVVNVVRTKSSDAKVLLMAIFPAGEKADDPRRAKIKAVNEQIANLADDHVTYMDIGPKLLAEDGTLSKEIAPDGLHPGVKGYEIWADAILPTLKTTLSSSH